MVLLASSEHDVPRRVSLDVASTILIKDTHELGNEPPSRSEIVYLRVLFKVLSSQQAVAVVCTTLRTFSLRLR